MRAFLTRADTRLCPIALRIVGDMRIQLLAHALMVAGGQPGPDARREPSNFSASLLLLLGHRGVVALVVLVDDFPLHR